MKILTDKQQTIFDFILKYKKGYGVMPGYPELQDEFNYSSSNSVYQHLQALVRKNHLVQSDGSGYQIHSRYAVADDLEGIPVQGRITAGAMHEAISENLGHLPVEIHPTKSDHYFALIVDGDSMIEADIRDGDYILIDPREPEDGEIGAILYHGETTLKTIKKTSTGVELQPENPTYEAILIEPEEWEEITVFGTYIGKAWKNNGNWGLIFRS